MDTPIWQYFSGFTIYTGIVVLALVGITHWIQKRGGTSLGSLSFLKKKVVQNPYQLKVESSMSLEPRKNVYVVRSGDQRLLVGSTPEGLSFMTALESVPEADTQVEVVGQCPGSAERFVGGDGVNRAIGSEMGASSIPFVQVLQQMTRSLTQVPVVNRLTPWKERVRSGHSQPLASSHSENPASSSAASPDLNNVEQQLTEVILAYSAKKES